MLLKSIKWDDILHSKPWSMADYFAGHFTEEMTDDEEDTLNKKFSDCLLAQEEKLSILHMSTNWTLVGRTAMIIAFIEAHKKK